MKYEKPQVEVMKFDYSEFMTGSTDPMSCPSDAGTGHTCGQYVKGSSCGAWTSTSFGGAICNNYDGKKCYSYTDNRHPVTNPCTEYGYNCSKF